VRIFFAVSLLIVVSAFAFSQDERPFRGSIPEELLRPRRGETPRYPVDMIIGELGRGSATEAAYFYANTVITGFMSGLTGHPALSSIDSVLREELISDIDIINPVSYRIGGGRREADGSVSFLVRFIGKDQTITSELYIRYSTNQTTSTGSWVFDELHLEEPRDREIEYLEALNRNDFYPYERFY